MPFNFSTDLRIEFRLPVAGDFVLGVSTLGGTDKLGSGTSSGTWQNFTTDVYNVEINRGMAFNYGVLAAPLVGEATIEYRGTGLNPLLSAKLHPGVAVQIYTNTGGGTPFLFSGFIDAFQTSFTENGVSVVSIHCVDIFRKILNTRYPSTIASGAYKTWLTSVFNQAITATNYANSGLYNPTLNVPASASATTLDAIATVPNMTADLVQLALDAEQAKCWVGATGQVNFTTRTTTVTRTANGKDGGATGASDFNYSDIQFQYDGFDSTNSIIATSTNTPAVTTILVNQNAIELFGENPLDIGLWISNQTQMDSWASNITLVQPRIVATSVSFDAINKTTGELEYMAWFDSLGYSIGVYNDTISNNYVDTLPVIGIHHSIVPDFWNVTLELQHLV